MITPIMLIGAIGYSANRILNVGNFEGNSIRVDGQAFDGLSNDDSDDSLLKHARIRVLSGVAISNHVSAHDSLRMGFLPDRFQMMHTLSFGTKGSTNEIITGNIRSKTFNREPHFMNNWEYHQSGNSGKSAIAIRDQKGIKTIVLINRDRGTFLAFTQKGT